MPFKKNTIIASILFLINNLFTSQKWQSVKGKCAKQLGSRQKKGNCSRARSPHCAQEQQQNPLLHQIHSKPGKSGQTGKIPAGAMKEHLTLAKASVPRQFMSFLCDSSTAESLWEFPTCRKLHNTKRKVSKLLTSGLRLDRAQMLLRLGKSAQNSFRVGWGVLKSEDTNTWAW